MDITDDFDVVRSVYGSCAFNSFWLGILLNVLLVWLILRKTPAPMQIYNKLLMAPCFMCILIAITTFLVQPIPIVDHGYHAVIQNGPLRSLAQPWNYTANVAWFQLFLLFVCCTAVQFAFRYYMMSRAFSTSDGQIPVKLKYVAGFAIYLLLVAHVGLHYWSDYPREEYQPSMAQLARMVHAEIGISHIRFSSFTWAREWPWIMHCLAMVLMFALCYLVIVICAIRTNRFVAKLFGDEAGEIGSKNSRNVKNSSKNKKASKKGKRNNKSGSSSNSRVSTRIIEMAACTKQRRLRQLNAQVTMAFVVQAVLPTINVIELTVQTTLPIFFHSTRTINYMVYAAIPLYFIPVLNPLATMLLVRPYQVAVFKMLGLNRQPKMPKVVVGNAISSCSRMMMMDDAVGGKVNARSGSGNGSKGQRQQQQQQKYLNTEPQAVLPMFTIS